MAKIKFSALVSDMRNKLNGSVLSKNRYGSYMRNKTTPVNPQTTYQQNARSVLAALSQAWSGLTESQRKGWSSLATTLPFTDIFGDPKTLAGNALYVSLNSNLAKLGVPAISVPPIKTAIPAVTIVGLNAMRVNGVMMALEAMISSPIPPAGFGYVVYATPGVGPGISFVKNQFRLVKTITTDLTAFVNFTDEFIDRFGTAAVGSKVFVRIAVVSLTSGQQGIPSEAMAFVTGT